MQRTAFNHEVSQSELNYLRSQGLNNQEIAERVGCSAATINKYLPSQRKARVKLTDKDYKDILELHNDGNSAKEIAETYGCVPGTIWRILRNIGVETKQRTTETEPEVQEEPKQDIPEQPQDRGGRMTVYQMGLYDGWKGVYKVNLTEHTVEFPELPKTMERQELGFYIRDLMQIWKEM